MTTTDIKKALYKQKPEATLQKIRVGVAYYETTIRNEEGLKVMVEFQVPVNDMGDADYFPIMETKLLNRYIITQVV